MTIRQRRNARRRRFVEVLHDGAGPELVTADDTGGARIREPAR